MIYARITVDLKCGSDPLKPAEAAMRRLEKELLDRVSAAAMIPTGLDAWIEIGGERVEVLDVEAVPLG